MKKLLLFNFLAFILCLNVNAGHSISAEITYKSIANKKFEVTLKFYRDCRGLSVGNPGEFAVVCGSGGTKRTFSYSKTSIKDITPICKSASIPCNPQNTANPSGPFGTEEHTYVGVIDFNSAPYSTDVANGCCEFEIYYRECCRSSVNVAIDATDFYVSALLNVCKAPTNSSPVPTSVPIVNICCNQPFYGNPSYVESDGDSLVFSMVAAMDTPGHNYSYNTGYTPTKPLSVYFPTGWPSQSQSNPNANPPIGFFIDRNIGNIVFTPTACTEVSTLVIQVEEYRKDTSGAYHKIGSVKRDYMIIVRSCNSNNPPLLTNTTAYSVCTGNQICFDVTATDSRIIVPPPATSPPTDSIDMYWNSGIDGATFTVDSQSLGANSTTRTGHFCWTPDSSKRSGIPYRFSVTARDNKCGSVAVSTKAYSVKVLGHPTANRKYKKMGCGIVQFKIEGDSNLTQTWTVLDSNGNQATSELVSRSVFTGRIDTTIFYRSGRYYIRVLLNNAGNCPVTVVDTLDVIARSNVFIPGKADTILCRNVPTSLTVSATGHNSPFRYKWITDVAYQVKDTLETYTFTPDTHTRVWIQVTDSQGCVFYDSIKIKVSGSFKLGNDTAVCPEKSVQFEGPLSWPNYSWSNGSSTRNIIVNTPGQYVLTTTDTMGCKFKDSVRYDSLAIQGVRFFNSDTAFCKGDTLSMSGTAGWSTYKWNTGFNQRVLQILSGGTYSLAVTDVNGCAFSDTFTVVRNEVPPKKYGGAFTMVCKGVQVAYEANPGYASYQWSHGPTTRQVIVSKAGTYYVTVTDSNGCSSKDHVVLALDSVPDVNYTVKNVGLRNYEFTSNLGPSYAYKWTFGDGNTSTALNAQHFYASTGKYNVCLIATNTNFCADTFCSELTVTSVKDAVRRQDINVYPNPTGSDITLNIHSNGTARMQVSAFDMLGREFVLVADEPIVGGNNEILLRKFADLPAGLYLFKVSWNGESASIKVVKTQ